MPIRLNNRALVTFGLVSVALIATLAFSGQVRAEEGVSKITFPVAELGNCTDRDACKAYCALVENRTACQAFAASHSLKNSKVATSTADGSKLRTLLKADGGPGDCAIGATDPKKACKAYCDSRENIDVCVAYGRAHNLFTGERLGQAVKAQIKLGTGTTTPFIKLPADFKLYLSHAPDVVRRCVVAAIGQERLDAIASGASTPDAALGAKIKACFEQHRQVNLKQRMDANASTTRPARPAKVRAEHQASTTNMGSTTKPVRPIPPARTRLENASSTSFGDFLLLRASGLASAFAALLH